MAALTVNEESFVEISDDDVNGLEPFCYGAPIGWVPRGPPEGWLPPTRRPNELPFEDIDNPGGWPEHIYSPKINGKTREYLWHALPAGATPVPADDGGNCLIDGWKFNYRGWER
jgi:hypothetical protein